jgi:hypothetical protein
VDEDSGQSAFDRMQEDGNKLENEYEAEKEEKVQKTNGSNLAPGTLGSNSRGIPATG